MRKCEVFTFAAKHAAGAEAGSVRGARGILLRLQREDADQHADEPLHAAARADADQWVHARGIAESGSVPDRAYDHGRPIPFRSQRQNAIRKLAVLGGAAIAALSGTLLWLWLA